MVFGAADDQAAPCRGVRRAELTRSDSPSGWMTLDEVAEYLRLSRSKLYDLAPSGGVPCSKVAGRWRFFRREIDEWMLQQRPSRTKSED